MSIHKETKLTNFVEITTFFPYEKVKTYIKPVETDIGYNQNLIISEDKNLERHEEQMKPFFNSYLPWTQRNVKFTRGYWSHL